MRDKLINHLYQLRAENENHEPQEDPLDSERLLFTVQRDLTRHSDEELLKILEYFGQFEG